MGILTGAVGWLRDCVPVRGIQRKGNILIDAAALRPVPVIPPDHGALQDKGLHLHIPCRHQRPGLPLQVDDLVPLVNVERRHRTRLYHGNAALVAGGVPAVPIQCPGSIRLIESAVRVIRFHGIAVLGADAVCLHYKFIAPAFPHIECVQRICHFPVFPCRHIPFVVGAVSFAERHKHRLVIVAGERCRSVILYDWAFAAALTAGADFQRLGCVRLHHERLVIAAHPICGIDRGCSFQRSRVSGILRMVLIERHRSRHRPGTERGRSFLFIPDSPCFCGMLRAETGRFQYARGMVRLCPQGAGHVIRHIHPLPALVV